MNSKSLKDKIARMKQDYRLEMVQRINLMRRWGKKPVFFTLGGDFIYLVYANDNRVSRLDARTLELQEELQLEMVNPFGIDCRGSEFYVCDRGGGSSQDSSLKIFNLDTGKLQETIEFTDYLPSIVNAQPGNIICGTSWLPGQSRGCLWKIENKKKIILYQNQQNFIPRNVFVKEPYIYVSSFTEGLLYKIAADSGTLIEKKPLYRGWQDKTVITDIPGDYLIGITDKNDLVKFDLQGNVIYYAKNILPKANNIGGFIALKYANRSLYTLDNRNGDFYIFSVD